MNVIEIKKNRYKKWKKHKSPSVRKGSEASRKTLFKSLVVVIIIVFIEHVVTYYRRSNIIKTLLYLHMKIYISIDRFVKGKIILGRNFLACRSIRFEFPSIFLIPLFFFFFSFLIVNVSLFYSSRFFFLFFLFFLRFFA